MAGRGARKRPSGWLRAWWRGGPPVLYLTRDPGPVFAKHEGTLRFWMVLSLQDAACLRDSRNFAKVPQSVPKRPRAPRRREIAASAPGNGSVRLQDAACLRDSRNFAKS